MAAIDAYLTSHPHLGNLPHRDCGDEYRMPPYLTASGDLSHHLSANLPPIYTVQQVLLDTYTKMYVYTCIYAFRDSHSCISEPFSYDTSLQAILSVVFVQCGMGSVFCTNTRHADLCVFLCSVHIDPCLIVVHYTTCTRSKSDMINSEFLSLCSVSGARCKSGVGQYGRGWRAIQGRSDGAIALLSQVGNIWNMNRHLFFEIQSNNKNYIMHIMLIF